ncbi:hypothetical protein Barb7_03009 [Bacteroidales bacterium Barb7]|nr:hypothetical protein Barb7_03009 [Bacteroidales bacterium Barb7]
MVAITAGNTRLGVTTVPVGLLGLSFISKSQAFSTASRAVTASHLMFIISLFMSCLF